MKNVDPGCQRCSNYLDRWGMTCQRPTRRAYSQDDVKLKTFMNETYPAIAAKAKKEGAKIYWGDETGINNQEYHVRGFAPKGQTPTVPSFSKVEKINMISAINNKGTCRFMCYTKELAPEFLSEHGAFFLTLKNLNYYQGNKAGNNPTNHGEINGGINGEINGGINLSGTERKIVAAIRKNPDITRTDLSSALSIGTSTIDRTIRKLKNSGILERIGSNKTGYWKVNEP